MNKPEPEVGLVIRYDFLWSHERAKGYAAGVKDRPCVIVTAVIRGEQGQTRVLLAPITHSTPANSTAAVDIPPKVARHLGLDGERGYIITGETNAVSWDDPGIVPAIPGRRWAYGRLPEALYAAVRRAMAVRLKTGKLKSSDRQE